MGSMEAGMAASAGIAKNQRVDSISAEPTPKSFRVPISFLFNHQPDGA